MSARTTTRARPQRHEPSELSLALKACRSALIGIGVMSAMINVLYLTGSFFIWKSTTAWCRAAACRP